MKLMRMFGLLMVSALVLGCVAQAADVEGILMDKMCSGKALKDGMKAAQGHTRECALMPDCMKSGYGLFTADNKFLTLDAAGNKQAVQALRASKQKDNLRVKVTGEVTGGTIKVQSLKLL
jgi:hypothetical protein